MKVFHRNQFEITWMNQWRNKRTIWVHAQLWMHSFLMGKKSDRKNQYFFSLRHDIWHAANPELIVKHCALKLRWYIFVTALCIVALSRYIIVQCMNLRNIFACKFYNVFRFEHHSSPYDEQVSCIWQNVFAFVQRCSNTSILTRNEHKLLLHSQKHWMNREFALDRPLDQFTSKVDGIRRNRWVQSQRMRINRTL